MKRLSVHYGLWAAILLQDTSGGFAQTATAPAAPKPSKRSGIHAGRVLDARTGRYRNDIYTLVEGERIAGIGPSAPTGVPVLDLSSQTVLPGLIDCHAHIGATRRMTRRLAACACPLRWLRLGATAICKCGSIMD
jgi:adenine deaminase